MKKVVRVEDETAIGVVAVEEEEPVMDKVDEVQVVAVHATATKSLEIFMRIFGNRVEEYMMRKKKTMGIMLENQTSV